MVIRRRYRSRMSYNLTLPCGCTVYVACHPETRVAHTRVIERRGLGCRTPQHEVGARVYLWELLPEARPQEAVTQI